jgi:hypothetical protein
MDDDEEAGEDVTTGLLPNLARLRAMAPHTRDHLIQLTADWEGPIIEAWRADVAYLDDEEGDW